jgi:hypothetical protein
MKLAHDDPPEVKPAMTDYCKRRGYRNQQSSSAGGLIAYVIEYEVTSIYNTKVFYDWKYHFSELSNYVQN